MIAKQVKIIEDFFPWKIDDEYHAEPFSENMHYGVFPQLEIPHLDDFELSPNNIGINNGGKDTRSERCSAIPHV